ncbi:lasso RiPP family leader peptide-containing protein [Streptomyces sp. NPDC079020]
MENTEEKVIADLYEPPALVEVGEFSEDTLGFGFRYPDAAGQLFS